MKRVLPVTLITLLLVGGGCALRPAVPQTPAVEPTAREAFDVSADELIAEEEADTDLEDSGEPDDAPEDAPLTTEETTFGTID